MADALGLAVNCLSVVDIAAKVCLALLEYGRIVIGARTDIQRLREQVERLAHVAQAARDLLQKHGQSYDLHGFEFNQQSFLSSETDLRLLLSRLEKGRTPM